jgi:hypothetical protein
MPNQYQLPLWLAGLLIITVLFVALEFGYRIGLIRRDLWKDADPSNGQIILTSMFAILGLFLAFTYGAGVERFDASKRAVVHEANTLSTAFLRADLMTEPGRTEIKQALLDYARTRTMRQGRDLPEEQFKKHIKKSLQAQSKLWPITEQIIEKEHLDPIVESRMIDAIDEVLNAHAIRLAAIKDRLPISVIFMLFLVASASLSVAGFNAGISGRLNRWRMMIFALVLVGVMLVIYDFDHPIDGFIRISHDSIINGVNEMEANLAQ